MVKYLKQKISPGCLFKLFQLHNDHRHFCMILLPSGKMTTYTTHFYIRMRSMSVIKLNTVTERANNCMKYVAPAALHCLLKIVHNTTRKKKRKIKREDNRYERSSERESTD